MKKTYRVGSYPTMITPYKADGSVDYETARKYVRWYAENGCDGIFSNCQSSEIFFLSLEERIKLQKTVYDEVLKIEQETGNRLTVVASGHVSDTIEGQAEELCKIAETGADAIILITNRLDIHNEGDDVWIQNAEALLEKLPPDIGLGLYECPYPYKRLLTPRILNWCLEKGRFYFIKDTCCDIHTIRERMEILGGTQLMLLNANCQTLLDSLKAGGSGYCGIMANYHPKLYAWLCHNYKTEPEKAKRLQEFLCMSGFTENGLSYPLSAKYHMCLEGIPTENLARNKESNTFTDYGRACMHQMRSLSQYFEAMLGGKDDGTFSK